MRTNIMLLWLFVGAPLLLICDIQLVKQCPGSATRPDGLNEGT
jgi:hypothetical protein